MSGVSARCFIDREDVARLCDVYLGWEERELTDDDIAFIDRVMQSRGFRLSLSDVMYEAASGWIQHLISDEMHKTKEAIYIHSAKGVEDEFRD